MVGGATLHMTYPAGYHRPEEKRFLEEHPAGRFEYHTTHEEIFALEGEVRFGKWYAFRALAYLNHPPYWLHPADQYSDTGVVLLMKYSGEVDFYFLDIPEDWDGVEYYAPGMPESPSLGHTCMDLDLMPWEPVLDSQGPPSGVQVRHLWEDVERGWTTWMIDLPPGWHSSGPRNQVPGGDELFLLDGSLRVDWEGEPVDLDGQGYYCAPDSFTWGGDVAMSATGCTAIRWTKGVDLRSPDLYS
jgi:hypothetical protein